MSTRSMRCREARPYLSAYVDGELDSALQERIQEHLASCATCRQAVARYQAVDDVLGRLPAPGPSPEVLDRILASTYSVNRERAVRQSLRRPEKPLAPRSLPAFILADTNLAAPLRLARASAQLRRSWVQAWALPALAALLVIALALVSFQGRLRQTKVVTPTPVVSIQSQLKIAREQADRYYLAQKLPFLPVMPTTLPSGATFGGVSVTSSGGGEKYLDVVWSLGAPFTNLHLREMAVPLAKMPGYSEMQPTAVQTWQVPGYPQWEPMSDNANLDRLVEGEDMSQVYLPQFSVTLDIGLRGGGLLDQSNSQYFSALGDLMLTSLSLDLTYKPLGAIAAPDTSLVVHYVMQMPAAVSDGPSYQWDVYWDQPHDVAKAELYTATSSGDPGTLLFTDYKILFSSYVTRCNAQNVCESILSSSRLVENDPFTLGFEAQNYLDSDINENLRDGELWNLGGPEPAPAELGLGGENVDALAVVGGPYPITIYVSSGASPQVVGVISQIGASASPGGPDAQSPFVPLDGCPVSYPLIVYQPSSSWPDSFWSPPPQSTPGHFSVANVPNMSTCSQG